MAIIGSRPVGRKVDSWIAVPSAAKALRLLEVSGAGAKKPAGLHKTVGKHKGNIGMAGTIEKSLLAVALFGIVLPHAGWTDGPSRQKITETIQIDAPPAKVWATIADFHDMRWLPGVAKTTGEGGNDPDVAKRQLTLDGGATIDESLYQYDAGAMSFARHGPPVPLRGDLSCFRLLIADRSPIDPAPPLDNRMKVDDIS